MARRTTAARRVKRNRTYLVEEAAEVTGLHPHTIRRWIRSGSLKAITDRRPYLIPGRFLIDCLNAYGGQGAKLAPNEFLCFRCQAPRCAVPCSISLATNAGDEAGAAAPRTMLLRASCAVCGCAVFRRIRAADAENFLTANTLPPACAPDTLGSGGCPSQMLP